MWKHYFLLTNSTRKFCNHRTILIVGTANQFTLILPYCRSKICFTTKIASHLNKWEEIWIQNSLKPLRMGQTPLLWLSVWRKHLSNLIKFKNLTVRKFRFATKSLAKQRYWWSKLNFLSPTIQLWQSSNLISVIFRGKLVLINFTKQRSFSIGKTTLNLSPTVNVSKLK